MQQSIASLFELYLARSDLRPSSVRFKKQALGHFLRWFGDVPVGSVTAAVAEDYRTLLVKEGRSKRTANGYLANFRPFWNWLARHGRVPTNPFEAIKPFKVTEQSRQTFSAAELGRLLMVSDDLWRVRICLGLLGCRPGEMLNVVAADIHMDADVPHILLSPKSPGPDTWGWELKDHAVRYVALPVAMQFVGVTVELHRLVGELVRTAAQPYVFLESRYYRRNVGKTWVPDPTGNFQRMFRTLQRRAGIEPPRRFHELRAAFATAMIPTVGLSRTADALGHSTTQLTRKYDRHSEMLLLADVGSAAQKCYKSLVP